MTRFAGALPRAEQARLQELAKAGDRAAQQRLIASVLPYGLHFARRFTGRGIPIEDLVQLASLGILRAVQDWDPSKGALLTLAQYWCRNFVMTAVYCDTKVIRNAKRMFFRGKDRTEEEFRRYQEQFLPRYEGQLRAHNETQIGDSVKKEERSTYNKMIDRSPGPAEHAEEREEQSRRDAALRAVHRTYRRVLDLRLQVLTLQEVGRELGVSKQRAGQIEAKAIAKARAAYERLNAAA